MQSPQLQEICDAVPVAMLMVDARARVVCVNAAATALFGPGMTNRPFVTLLRQRTVNVALDWVLEHGARGATLAVREALPPPPAGATSTPHVPGALCLSAALSAGGRDLNAVVTISPLPISRGAAVAIEDATGVEQAEQMRRDFVANVSHELRTPLTALIGFIETLRGPARDDAAARDRFLGIMAREAGRMSRLIADLLSLSRVEQEERRRPAQDVDLAALVRSTAATLGPAARAANMRLHLVNAEKSVMLPGDADQIVQVFHNLIENAIKYGASGGEVRVTLTHVPHEAVLRGPGWAVEVADDGEGIDALHLPRLTERFYRIDTHRSREKGGTGLGLAIVKHIVNRHRGRLKIESIRGQGSRFTVILPERRERV